MKRLLFAFASLAVFGSISLAEEGQQQAQGQSAMTMQQLVAKCTHLQGFGQITTIDAQITCSAQRLVWVNRGAKGQSKVGVPKTGVTFAAHIKGKYQSQQCAVDLSDVLANIPLLLQKWQFKTMQTVSVKSCQELQAIADNANYCAQQFSKLTDQQLQQLVQRTAVEQTTLESDNIMGEMVEEVLTSPLKVDAISL